MLDINLIREETERVKEGVRRKQISPSVVDEVLSYDIKWRAIVRELDELRSRQKKGSSQTLSPESRGELKKLKEEIVAEGKKEVETMKKRMEKQPQPILFCTITEMQSRQQERKNCSSTSGFAKGK